MLMSERGARKPYILRQSVWDMVLSDFEKHVVYLFHSRREDGGCVAEEKVLGRLMDEIDVVISKEEKRAAEPDNLSKSP